MAVDTIARAMAARAMNSGSGGSGETGTALMSVNYATAVPINSLPYTASADCMIIGSVYAPGGGYGLILNDKIVLAEEGYCNISILVNKGDVLSSNTTLTKIALYAAATITASTGSSETTVAGMGAPDYENAKLITSLPYTVTENAMAVGHVHSAGGGYSLTINNTIQLAEQGWSNLSFVLNKGDTLDCDVTLDEVAINIVPIKLVSAEGSSPTTSYLPLEDKPSINNVELVGDKTLMELGIDLTQFYLKTETYTQEEVNNLIANLTSFNFEIADPELPTTDISETTIYLVPTGAPDEDNYYEEWFYTNGKWEILGTTKIDLSDYATKEEVQEVQDNLDQEIEDRIAADKALQDQINELVEEAPSDDKEYVRKNEVWVEKTDDTGIEEAPGDGKQYARQAAAWEEVVSFEDAPIDDKQYLRQNETWVEYDDSLNTGNGVKYNLTSLIDGVTSEFAIADDIASDHAIGLFLNGLYLLEGTDYSVDYDNHTLTTKNVLMRDENISFVLVVGGLTGVPVSGYGIEEAPLDGIKYVRQDKEWIAAEQYLANLFAFDGTTLSFDISDLGVSNLSKIYINGIRLIYSIDYKIQSNTLEFQTSWTEEDSCLIEL